MIDGYLKHRIDPIWDRLARQLARHLTANQVTFAGLILVIVCCFAYLVHQSPVALGITLALAFSSDSLDGAVARLRGESSHVGGYLDAMVDRYQEIAIFAVLGLTADAAAPAFAACTGALLVSYAKARAAIEVPVSNDGWPDLFERQERIIFICALLIFGPLLSRMTDLPFDQIVYWGLWILAGLCHMTALQRTFRATRILSKADAARRQED